MCMWVYQASLVTGLVAKNLPAMQETKVRSLGQEDLLEKKMAIHSSILAWKNPMMKEPGGLQSVGLQRVRWTQLSGFTFFEGLRVAGSHNLLTSPPSVFFVTAPFIGEILDLIL